MRVKVFKKMYLVILTIFVILMSSSCKNDDPFHAKESGDWIYTIDDCGEGHCAILGLSEIGKSKEIIVLPTEIEGLKVSKYGNKKGYLRSDDIVFEKCKKLYCNSLVLTVLASFANDGEFIDVFLPDKYSQLHELYYSFYDDDNANLFFSFDSYMYGMNKFSSFGTKCHICNIEYHLNDENCFFVDNIESGKIEIIPPKPFKDGCVFDGWYYNDVKWDFNNNLVEDYFDENNRLRLDAKWISA